MTDYVNEEIRLGRLTRDQGIDLVTRYDDSCSPDYIAAFCDYIGISVDQFWEQVHASVNPRPVRHSAERPDRAQVHRSGSGL